MTDTFKLSLLFLFFLDWTLTTDIKHQAWNWVAITAILFVFYTRTVWIESAKRSHD